jgi:predicted nucleotidyltransferase
LSLLQRVAARLAEEEIAFAVIGAAAMAVHGVARSTMDLDLLVTEARVLDNALWRSFGGEGGDEVEIRRGDADDPLAGVVRFASPGERSVDLVVGKRRWQQEVVKRAQERSVAGLDLPVVVLSDLVLLKLFAGGPQDAWDLEQLLATAAPFVAEEVDHRIEILPRESRDLWRRLAPR